jgi:oligopeptide/dipeptide ABC transporter ATP-binding protein
MSQPLVRIENLKKYFPITGGIFQKTVGFNKAVDGVSFEINKGETLGLVGESGCGKSTVGRTMLRLYDKTEGRVLFNNTDIFKLNRQKLRDLRTRIQIVFQDPYSSLNPRMTIGNIIGEALLDHSLCTRNDYNKRVIKVMDDCGLPSYYMDRYPHEFSGGQRQRIGIARALAMGPEFIVADEPVSALDVSIQSQIINLMMDLQREHGLTYLFISHDLSVVEHISNRVAIMYLGHIVEIGPKENVFKKPLHPYTKALMSAVPIPDPTLKRERIVLEGDIPSSSNPPTGCKFHTRCPIAKDKCRSAIPKLLDMGNKHFAACHFAENDNLW